MKYEREIVEFVDAGRTLYDRGYATGSAGNMSVLLPDGNILATPTGSCMGRLDPETLSVLTRDGTLVAGAKATKDVLFTLALYATKPNIPARLHLHCCHGTALSCLQ